MKKVFMKKNKDLKLLDFTIEEALDLVEKNKMYEVSTYYNNNKLYKIHFYSNGDLITIFEKESDEHWLKLGIMKV